MTEAEKVTSGAFHLANVRNQRQRATLADRKYLLQRLRSRSRKEKFVFPAAISAASCGEFFALTLHPPRCVSRRRSHGVARIARGSPVDKNKTAAAQLARRLFIS